jgi:2,3-bisphosphoglycerate-independent phosphoglycerate mutase
VFRREHPGIKANSIWLWGQGKAPKLPSFQKKYGLNGGVISAVDLLKGIGVYAGLVPIDVPGVTGYLDTNYAGKVEYALSSLEKMDIVYLHVEAPDEASHSGQLELKMRAIEDFDHRVVAPILEGLKRFDHFRVLLITDHFTPVSVRTHTREPVPFVIYDNQEALSREPAPVGFNEPDAATQGLLIEQAFTLMDQLVLT